MTASQSQALSRLRRADPAAAATGGVELDQAVPVEVRRAAPAPLLAATGPEGRAGGRRAVPRLVLVGAAAAFALVAATVRMPWADHEAPPVASAYAVSTEADGTVLVAVRWSELSDPAGLQAALRGQNVPAVVLVESAPGTCRQPPQDGIALGSDAVVPMAAATAGEDRFALRPRSLPAGSTLVMGIPRLTGPVGSVMIYVTDQKAPTCLQPTTKVGRK